MDPKIITDSVISGQDTQYTSMQHHKNNQTLKSHISIILAVFSFVSLVWGLHLISKFYIWWVINYHNLGFKIDTSQAK